MALQNYNFSLLNKCSSIHDITNYGSSLLNKCSSIHGTIKLRHQPSEFVLSLEDKVESVTRKKACAHLCPIHIPRSSIHGTIKLWHQPSE